MEKPIVEKICRELHDQLTRQEGVMFIETVIRFDDGTEQYTATTERLSTQDGPKVGHDPLN